MSNPKLIRNVCILAHVDHGKTTISDSLLATNGLLSKRSAGVIRYLDDRRDEQERGITMKSSAVSLYYNFQNETKQMQDETVLNQDRMVQNQDGMVLNQNQVTLNQDKASLNQDNPTLNLGKPTLNQDKPTLNQDIPTLNQDQVILNQDQIVQNQTVQTQNEMVLNLIDTPGHIDFLTEVAAAVRICDGALIVVDLVEGVCVQTKEAIKQAYDEKVKMILVLNKIDRLIIELNKSVDDIFQSILRVIEDSNAYIAELKR